MKAAIVAALLLTGCATSERLVEIRIPTPIACQVAEPSRPMMDTDTIPLDAPIDTLARAMRAEIERREGYETQLLTALQSCKAIGTP